MAHTAPPRRPISHLVAVGASAGGVEALSTLVATLPRDFPAPVVIAQHLDPGRPSHLAEILARRSTLPVRQVTDHDSLENGVVFVVPANRHVEITDQAITLRTRDAGRVMPSVDLLLATAAQAYGENLIAVILTGSGSDGAAGARTVKEVGGTVVVQNPATAQFGAMPAAIAAPLVDVVAELEGLGPLLHDLLTGAYLPSAPADNPALRALLDELEQERGINFAHYKVPTIQRRLQRRLAATGTKRLGEYRDYLHSHPEEYERLVSTFLIKVTQFFRDPELFSYLREEILPQIVAAAREHGREGRLWSAGCATGEEAYSLAILLADVLGPDLERRPVRLFATDLDPAAVNYARRGLYPANAVEGLDPELVARHFTLLDGAYQVNKRVRSLVIFGEHDLGQRAPFPNIDLCLCRNVLIYFAPHLQQRALQLFAFSMRDGGYLVLGKSESPGLLGEFFVPANPQLKVYRREGERVPVPALRIRQAAPLPARPRPRARPAPAPPPGASATQDEAALWRALPWGTLVVDRHYDIVRLNPAARRLLGIHGAGLGEDLVHLTEELPAPGLRAAVDAILGGAPEGDLVLPTETLQGQRRHLRLLLRPYAPPAEGQPPGEAQVQIMVTDVTALEERRLAQQEQSAADLEALRAQHRAAEEAWRAQEARLQQGQEAALLLASALAARTERLSRALSAVEASNAQLAASNAELRSANEEFVVGNEELQAAMEEIETLNEEMQATNEELETLNEELQSTIEELHTTNDDLQARNLEMSTLAAGWAQERARLTSLLLRVEEAVLVVDQQGAVVLSNEVGLRLLGVAGTTFVPADAAGRPLPPPETPQALAARGEAFTMTFTLEGAHGRQAYEALGQPLLAEGGPRGSVVVVRPVRAEDPGGA